MISRFTVLINHMFHLLSSSITKLTNSNVWKIAYSWPNIVFSLRPICHTPNDIAFQATVQFPMQHRIVEFLRNQHLPSAPPVKNIYSIEAQTVNHVWKIFGYAFDKNFTPTMCDKFYKNRMEFLTKNERSSAHWIEISTSVTGAIAIILSSSSLHPSKKKLYRKKLKVKTFRCDILQLVSIRVCDCLTSSLLAKELTYLRASISCDHIPSWK